MDDESRSPLGEQPVLGVESVGTAVVIRLAGELDVYNADQVRAALTGAASAGPSRVVVDLGEVEFMDSTALGVLIEARRSLPEGAALTPAAGSAWPGKARRSRAVAPLRIWTAPARA